MPSTTSARTSLSPLPVESFGEAEARHLLLRAGFGGTPAQIRALADMGLNAAVDALVDFQSHGQTDLGGADIDPDVIQRNSLAQIKARQAARQSPTPEKAAAALRAEQLERLREDRRQLQQMVEWWLTQMISSPRPMEENLTLLWHGHFASNYRSIRDAYLLLRQQELFRTHANGSFRDLAHGIVRDPAMILFLNNNANRARKPNENLARELMELFTLGEGNYAEADIKEGARALTGYGVNDNDFEFYRRIHDAGEKTILGQTGSFDGDGFVDILLARDDCPKFIAWKLYRHFVADVDDQRSPQSDAVIAELAADLRTHDFELKPVLKTLLKSTHYYDPAVRGCMIKSPAQLVVGTIRALHTPTRNLRTLANTMNLMGQSLFSPPTVAGWDVGRAWINTSTMFTRQNLTTFLITGVQPGQPDARITGNYDPTFLVEHLDNRSPTAVADAMMDHLIGPGAGEVRRTQARDFAQQAGVDQRGLTELLLVITSMPEYQLC